MKTPFRMVILGALGCGKTHYMLKMLEEDYMNHFDYIFMLCLMLEDNKTYQNWKYLYVFVIACEHHEVDNSLQMIVNFVKNTNSFIILDNCAASQSVKNRTSQLIKLAFHGRHKGFSTIVSTQQLTSIAKGYRENMSKLVTFYNPDADDKYIIFRKYMRHVENEEKDEKKN